MKEWYSKIIGTGSYLPKKIITNQELTKIMDTSDEWIQSRTGIKQRHQAVKPENTTSMVIAASEQAIKSANLIPNDIDLIIVGTASADHAFPSTACYVQKHFHITNGCPAFDINSACTGFIYALSIADQYIRAGKARAALVAGAETITSHVDWADRSTAVLFGDGAGAVILQGSEEPGIHSTHLHAAGEYADLLYLNHPACSEEAYIKMQGNAIFKLAITKLGEAIDEALEKNNKSKKDLDWLIPHQANLRIIQAIAERLELPAEKVIITVDQHANTSAASVPLALDYAVRSEKIKRGDLLLLEAFGGGLTWGSALITY